MNIFVADNRVHIKTRLRIILFLEFCNKLDIFAHTRRNIFSAAELVGDSIKSIKRGTDAYIITERRCRNFSNGLFVGI